MCSATNTQTHKTQKKPIKKTQQKIPFAKEFCDARVLCVFLALECLELYKKDQTQDNKKIIIDNNNKNNVLSANSKTKNKHKKLTK